VAKYDAVEPENRLGAGELEARWEQTLTAIKDIEGRLSDQRATRGELSAGLRVRLLTRGVDVEEVIDLLHGSENL
jgi:hypothetical protein